MGFLEIHPKYRAVLRQAGLRTASDFLAAAGTDVNIRPERRVQRLDLGGGLVAYLKKETRIWFRERLGSWWSGFGWTSKSVREAFVLGELTRENVGCPLVLALGEESGQAFVMLKAETDLEPLGPYLRKHPDRMRRFAVLIGRELARMHEAGFYHPDLFAKHVLVGQADGLDRVCFIDWQRTRRLPEVAWSRRIIDLATFDASLDASAVPERERLRLLASYLRTTPGPKPTMRKLIEAIRTRAWLLLRQRRVRRQQKESVRTAPVLVGPHDWHGWRDCPLRLTDPSLAVLPLVKFLARGADPDCHRRRRALVRLGRALRELHEAGYVPTDPGLESWMLRSAQGPTEDDVEILLTSVADLVPTTAPPPECAVVDLVRLLARHGSSLSRFDGPCVVRGYLGPQAPRRACRDLVRRILDAREPAR